MVNILLAYHCVLAEPFWIVMRIILGVSLLFILNYLISFNICLQWLFASYFILFNLFIVVILAILLWGSRHSGARISFNSQSKCGTGHTFTSFSRSFVAFSICDSGTYCRIMFRAGVFCSSIRFASSNSRGPQSPTDCGAFDFLIMQPFVHVITNLPQGTLLSLC